jgi:hypothetical protein
MAGLALEDDDAFAALQARLRPFSQVTEAGQLEERTVLAIPSLNYGEEVLGSHASELAALEERFLYLVFALRRPGARLVLVTSEPIPEPVVDYYVGLIPEVPDARERFHLLTPAERSLRPLSRKLLDRPELLAELAALAGDRDRAFIMPFNVRREERDLALVLGVPIYGVDSRFERYGTKTGSRRLFESAGVPHPRGVNAIRTRAELADALIALRAWRPGLEAAVVKHDDGVYGDGNHIVRLRDLPPPGTAEERAAVDVRLRSMRADYLRTLAQGGIVEEMIAGEIRSPSVQLRILPGGRPLVISTHDQVLGGAAGQSFVACTFPADPEYAALVVHEARKVGDYLARQGVMGRFGVDFIVARREHGWEPYAVEINLREGGTSHPYGALWLLTDGAMDDDKIAFRTPDGRAKHYFATDRLGDPAYRGITIAKLLEAADAERVGWDQQSQTGAIFHMPSLLTSEGRLGVTAIADSPDEAQEIYLRVVGLLDRLARRPPVAAAG